jgi:hypothetical protein
MFQCTKQKPSSQQFCPFEFGPLDIVWDFVLRISDLKVLDKL